MKPKLKHMKRNTQTRKDYQKNLDNIKQTKEYKKKLLKFLKFYCKANALHFFHQRVLVLYDEGREKELAELIRDAWVENNSSIRRDQTGFIDNSQYLEALIDNLLNEIPRIHSDDEDAACEDEWSSDEEGEQGVDHDFDKEQKQKDEEDSSPPRESSEMPRKKRKISEAL